MANPSANFSPPFTPKFGEHHYGRVDLDVKPGQKEKAIAYFSNGKCKELLNLPVTRRENLDGIKLYLGSIGWVMVRASGTENLLRVYCERTNGKQRDARSTPSSPRFTNFREPSMEHRFFTLDVFTTTRFEGNPLAVFTDGDGLSDDRMQIIAREMNLAETVFVQKPTDDRALARLRIFTTNQELKTRRTPVVGTWFLLAELGVVPARKAAFTSCNKRAPEFFRGNRLQGRPPQPRHHDANGSDIQARQNQESGARQALGLSPKDLDSDLDPECVSTGLFNLMVPLKNRAALAKIEMNTNELRRLAGKAPPWPTVSLSAATAKLSRAACSPGNSTRRRHGLSRRFSRRVPRQTRKACTGPHAQYSSGSGDGAVQATLKLKSPPMAKSLVPRVSGAAVRVFEGSFHLK